MIIRNHYLNDVGVIRSKNTPLETLMDLAVEDCGNVRSFRYAIYSDGTFGVEFGIDYVHPDYTEMPDHVVITRWSETMGGLVNV